MERKGKVYEAVNKASSLIGIEDLEKAKRDIYERVKNYSDLFEERRLEVIGEEFLLSNAIYREELRGREKREIKKFLTALLFPLTKEEIPKEYKTLLGIEIEFF